MWKGQTIWVKGGRKELFGKRNESLEVCEGSYAMIASSGPHAYASCADAGVSSHLNERKMTTFEARA